jgi:predicted dehydrogenase
MPWFQEARSILDQGLLGRPLGGVLPPAARRRARAGGLSEPPAVLPEDGALLVHETAIHLIDVFRFLLGEMTAVFARLKRFNPVIAGEGCGSSIASDFASERDRGCRRATASWTIPRTTRMTMASCISKGTGGSLRSRRLRPALPQANGGEERELPYAWTKGGYGGDCVLRPGPSTMSRIFWMARRSSNTAWAYLRNFEIEEAGLSLNAEKEGLSEL